MQPSWEKMSLHTWYLDDILIISIIIFIIIIYYYSAVVCNSESQWPDLWSKWPFFDMVFYNNKIQQYSGPLDSTLPLTGAL